MKYRAEIDGLRTIAVCSVLIYHAKVVAAGYTVLPGGFLGVDLFFVLSGFLITRILLGELETTGGLSIRRFYERRARRILPALFLVMLLSIPAALVILEPAEIVVFGWSLVASAAFVSNIYWWVEQGTYGAASGLLHPFLHTWSLAVEEQFYILFPPLLLLFWRFAQRWLLVLLALGIGVGLIGAHAVSMMNPQFSFFWLPSRGWELLAGALLARLDQTMGPNRNTRLGAVLPSLGLALIVLPMIVLDLPEIVHPGLATIPAVLGTCLVIRFAGGADPATRLLASRPFVAIGLISYALYLWHYPIFAFGRLLDADPGLGAKAIWMALSFAGAILSYRLVEEPFRRSKRIGVRGVVIGSVAGTVAVVGFAVVMTAGDGFRERFPQLAAIYGENEFVNTALRDESWSVLDTLAGDERVDRRNAHKPSESEATDRWFTDAAETRVLIVGDSHSKDAFNALYLNRDRFEGVEFARFGISLRLPRDQLARLEAAPNFDAADHIFLSFQYNNALLARLPRLLDRLARHGKPITILTRTAEFEPYDGRPLYDGYVRAHHPNTADATLRSVAWAERSPEPERINIRLREIAAEAGVPVFERPSLVCDDAAETCDLVTPEGRKAFYDNHHFTLDGARHFGKRIPLNQLIGG